MLEKSKIFKVHVHHPFLRFALASFGAMALASTALIAYPTLVKVNAGTGGWILHADLLMLARWALLPLIAALFIIRPLTRSTLEIRADRLVLRRADTTFEIPFDAIESVQWRVFPPLAGWIAFRMKTGRKFRYGIVVGSQAAGLTEAIRNAQPALVDTASLAYFSRFSSLSGGIFERIGARWSRKRRLVAKYVLFPAAVGLALAIYGMSTGMWTGLSELGLAVLVYLYLLPILFGYFGYFLWLLEEVIGFLMIPGLLVATPCPRAQAAAERVIHWGLQLAFYGVLIAFSITRRDQLLNIMGAFGA